MYALFVEVTIDASEDVTLKHLNEVVVPTVSGLPGFRAGYWMPHEGTGVSIVVFENEENAANAANNMAVGSQPGPGVTVTRSEVRPVAASA
jgi:hypothetical protein